jgi:hypothetical protein
MQQKTRIAIQAGTYADFLATGGDPLREAAALRDVRAVFRAGVHIRWSLDSGDPSMDQAPRIRAGYRPSSPCESCREQRRGTLCVELLT